MENIYPKSDNEITCVFSTDDNYALYLGVAIQSLISNSSERNNYGIYILEENLSEYYKKLLLELETQNVHIKFINTNALLSKYPHDIFYTHGHFTKATYYRFFISDIFSNFKKIIYLDCDLIINTDIKKLFNINLDNNLVGCINSSIYKSDEMVDYIISLGIQDHYKYFNSGVIVFDIDKLKSIDFTNQCIITLKKHKQLWLLDQDVLNIVFEGCIKFLDASWNVFNNNLFKDFQDKNRKKENENYYKYLEECAKKPKIMHYTSSLKPWNEPNLINAHFFWKYARKTPFYEMLLLKVIEKKIDEKIPVYAGKNYDCKKILSQIFSVKNSYRNNIKHKLITILGMKIILKV